jgi:uncharacterized protein (DUF885 family)
MTDTTVSPVDGLADRFWAQFLESQPTYATALGFEEYDDRLPDPSAEGRAREVETLTQLLAEASAISRDGLDEEDAITLDMLEVVARIHLRHHANRMHQFDAVDAMAGPQSLPAELSRYQRVDSAQRVDRLVRRLEGFPAFLAHHAQNLEEGLRAGRTAARPVVARVIEQTRRLVATPVDEAPLLVAHPELDDASRERLRRAIERHVQPALAAYLDALQRYAPRAREGDGVWALPDGEEVYETSIVAATTIEASARELHDYGLAQIEAIRDEQQHVARALGQPDVSALRRAMASDPAFRARQRSTLVELARGQIERAMVAAPRYFGRPPRAACEVHQVESYQEAEAPPAFYLPPTPDGSRPGIFYINTYQPESRPLHRIAAATFHEAVPGHHFQIAIETELEGLNAFRRLGSRLAGLAYAEGWGLYAERLADEMGLYADEHERLGMLDAQAWRAARLVVDSGIHAFRWTRQQSIDLLLEVGLSQLEAETETDRYITWPGQALAYMTGMREIAGLRRELEQRDGARFDLRAFHDAVLGHGSLPLATLRHQLPGWVTPRDA